VQVLDTAVVFDRAGVARWWFGMLAEIKATSADSGGQLTLVEVTCAPGYKGVRHLHQNEAEGFWIIEGLLDLEVGGKHIAMGAGDYASGPRGIPHCFAAVGEAGCRVLIILTPGGFEDMIMATSEPALERKTPPASTKVPDAAHLEATMAKFGVTIVD
jgi:quercetin dioxygenase-like cupin family protein